MKLRLELLSITAASVLAFGTALAADETSPTEPQEQASASVAPDQSPAETSGLPPQAGAADVGEDSQASLDTELDTEREAVGGGAAGGASEAPMESAESQDLPPEQAGTDLESDIQTEPSAAGGGQAGGALDSSEEMSASMGTDSDAQGMGGAMGSGSQYDQETIRQVQQALNDMGHDSGQVDGIVGPNTREALRAFQQEEGMSASGELDEQTLSALGVEPGQS